MIRRSSLLLLLGVLACQSGRSPTPPIKPTEINAVGGRPPAPPPEPKWTPERVLTFLLDSEREIYEVLPYPESDEKEPPIVGNCWDQDLRGYWKANDVLPVLNKRMTPKMRQCRMVGIGCHVGPWIARFWGGPIDVAFRDSKVVIVESSRDRVVADVEARVTDEVNTKDGSLVTSVIGIGEEPAVSRFVLERGADNVWRIADKTPQWANGDCDPGPVTLYATPLDE